MICMPLGIALTGTLTVCAPREEALEDGGPPADRLAADAALPSGAVEPAAGDSVPAELVGTHWRLVEFDAREQVPEDIEITAEFRQGGIAGQSACNRYTGPVEIDLAAGTIEIGAMVSTKMACPPPRMESETRYLGALQRATGVTLEPGWLTIRGEDEAGMSSTLVFATMEGP
jgi:heat shock protein HslJ